MLILTFRSDNKEAEIGIFDDDRQLDYEKWSAHRALAETVHLKIKELLDNQAKSLKDIEGIVVFKGPGSFTGLRIGLSVANALADSLGINISGTTGAKWIKLGISELKSGKGQTQVMPDYGAEPHVTRPKK